MDGTVILVDGYSHLYQSFYALPSLTAQDGRPTGAVLGLAKLLDWMEEQEPAYGAVVFDTPEPTFRHEAYEAYKATRKPMPEELARQLPLVEELLRRRGLASVSVPGFEADDVLGTLAMEAASRGLSVRIVSRDKDLKQLLGDRIRLQDPGTGETYGPEELEAETGLRPEQFRDFLGIAGDATDNVPGIPRLGPKKAGELLRRFGSLEEVLARWEETASLKGFGRKTAERIRDSAEEAELSKLLVTIRTDVPLPVRLEDLAFPGEPGEPLLALYRDLGFHSLLRDRGGFETTEEADYRAVTTPEAFADLMAALEEHDAWALDLETTSLDPLTAEVAGISFSWKAGAGRYLPFRAPAGESVLNEARCRERLEPLIADPAKRKAGQNLKFDVSVLRARGWRVEGVWFDTLVAAYLLNPGERDLGLDGLARKHLNLSTVPLSEVLDEEQGLLRFDEAPLDRAAPYAAEDADVAWRLAGVLEPRLREKGLWDLFESVEMPLVGVLADMELAGIALDAAVLERLGAEVAEELRARREAICEMAGETFNVNSPAQLRPILFERLGLPVVRRTKTGPSTATDVLEELAHLHPLPGAILAYRQLAKLQSTYIEVLPKLVHEKTGRLHADFNQAVTATGRLSSSSPNLQNIPVRTETGRRIREAFVAPSEDALLLTADYSQVELRMLAHLSGDENLRRAFRKGRDIHREVAARLFEVEPDRVDAEQRRKAKAVNFGLIYGQTPFGLSRFVGIPLPEARRFIDAYFERFPRVRVYFDELVAQAEESLGVRTILGRFRAVPDITASNRNRRAAAERTVVNTAIQGSAADLIKVAMVRLDRRLRREALPGRLLLQMHDELLLEVEAARADEVEAAVVEEMEGAIDLTVPLRVDRARGRNWRLA